MSRITNNGIQIKDPYISIKLCHKKFSGLVPEVPPNCRYMVDGTHLLQLVALFPRRPFFGLGWIGKSES